jgi:hypothetical protein
VQTITFSSLQTFGFKHTLISGMDFRESEEILLEELSEAVVVAGLKARGFEEAEEEADFFAVVKWTKAVTSYPGLFQSVDGPSQSLNRRDEPAYRFASRVHLALEFYESSTGNLFWRKELPNSFDALQLTEERVVDSLERALTNFPRRVERDPNLPDIQ